MREKLPPPNPKPHHALWWLCAVMTARAKNVPKLRLLAAVAMANPAASLAINQVWVVMAKQAVMVDVMVLAKALRHVAHVWGMSLFVRSVMPWNQPKTLCAAWLHTPMAKC
jgi:hypothetical protein